MNEEKLLLLLNNIVSRIDTMQAEVNTRFDTMQADINARFDRLEIRVDELEAKVDKLEAKVDKLEAKVDKLETSIAELKIGQAELRASQVDVIREVKTIREQTEYLTEASVEVRLNYKTLNAVTKENTYDIAKLKAAVNL